MGTKIQNSVEVKGELSALNVPDYMKMRQV